jgi:hypothetical protein
MGILVALIPENYVLKILSCLQCSDLKTKKLMNEERGIE